MSGGALVGTASLMRLFVRLDRARLVAWMAPVPLVTALTASSYERLYPTSAARRAFASTISNQTAIVALTGPPRGLDTIGGFTVWRVTMNAAVLLALMGIFLVARHTRGDEEAGRSDVVRALPVGRHAEMAAALLVVGAAQAATGILVAGIGLAVGIPPRGAVAFALVLVLVGWAFSAVSAVAAQVSRGARGAVGLAGVVLATSFAVRAVGDTARDLAWLAWLSPLGWLHRVRPATGERWWVLLLPLALAAVAAAGAVVLADRRDVGGGLLPERTGPGSAPAALRSPLTLSVRLLRASVVGWSIGLACAGVAFGAVASTAADLVEGNEQLENVLERVGGEATLADVYLSATAGLLAAIVAGFAVGAALRLRSEETAQRVELVLSGPVSRLGWGASHVLVVVGATALLLVVAGATMGIGYGAATGDLPGEVGRLVVAAVVHLPAVGVLVGLAVALFGLAPRRTVWAWAAMAAAATVTQMGAAMGFPQWMLDVSPLTHTPSLPAHQLRAAPLAVLSAVAAALVVVGLVGFRRRDVAG